MYALLFLHLSRVAVFSDETRQVFPGGNYDAKQDESYEMTAIRETFEETGVLLASASASSPTHFRLTNEEMERVREEIHSGRLLFKDFLHKHGLTPDVSSLLPFTQWVTPPPVLRYVFVLSLTNPSSQLTQIYNV